MSRQWKPEHEAAGYHLQEWGVATPDHEVVGHYEGGLEVRFLPAGPTGEPEYEIEWPDGTKVTVIDDKVVTEYLIREGLATFEGATIL